MTDAEIVERIATYLHEYVDLHSGDRKSCRICLRNAAKILCMVDDYRKLEAV